MFDIDNRVHENTINFLYQAATSILTKGNSSLKLIKSFYINKTRDIARRENLSIPNKIYGPMAMCQKCSVPWGEGTGRISVYSTKPKSQKINFIMVQKRKRNRKIIKKYVVLNCTTCKRRTKQILPKQVIAEMKPMAQPATNNTPQLIKSNNPPQIKVSKSKKSKNKSSKTIVSNKTIQKSKKPNQNHILQLAKLLSTSRPTAVSHEDKLKQFLK